MSKKFLEKMNSKIGMSDSKNKQTWSIIIFFHNEAGNIGKVCQQAMGFLSPLNDKQKEIIFVNDGSTDQSDKQIRKMTEGQSYVKFITHQKKSGIGACLKAGYEMIQMENVCAVPGDGQFDINELRAFRTVPPKTIISFFRTKNEDYSLLRKVLSKANSWFNKIFFGLHIQDINWVKIYKTDDLKKLSIKSKSSYIESEIIHKLKNKKCKIIQSPSRYLPRQYGHSKSVTVSSLKAVSRDIANLIFKKQ